MGFGLFGNHAEVGGGRGGKVVPCGGRNGGSGKLELQAHLGFAGAEVLVVHHPADEGQRDEVAAAALLHDGQQGLRAGAEPFGEKPAEILNHVGPGPVEPAAGFGQQRPAHEIGE